MSKLAKILKARANAWAAQRAEEEIGRSDLHDGLLESGIHVARPTVRLPPVAPANSDGEEIAQNVTLVVYGWHNVQPGPLSWVFPGVGQAIAAAKAMRNAVHWAVVAGHEPGESLDDARARGRVLLEHAG